MNIRRAENKDIPRVLVLLTQVVNIHHEGRPDLFGSVVKYTEKDLQKLFENEKRPVFVATDDEDRTVGYIFLVLEKSKGHHLVPQKTLYIDDLCVDRELRGTHIGRALYEHALSYARMKGCHCVTLHAWALNPDAEGFYRHLGMQTRYTCLETILS
ncbi:MAG: GNAT family N-acetyltransferase [Lachnospiraceae bacterium]|nr:GNAT family N-acetyltransferase [Lachnospiraceae bacterium]